MEHIPGKKMQHGHHFLGQLDISSDLKNQSIRGGIVTLAGQVMNQILQIGVTMSLARLLSPNEFGLLAMVTAIVGFVLLFKDLGLVQATVQRKQVTHQQISTLFWINIAMSIILMLIVILLAPVLVWYYQEPKLYWITIALSFGFVFAGVGVQHEALLRRNMRFRSIAAREVFATCGGGVVGIVLAWQGAGVWSLVAMALTKNLIQSITVWLACGWCPCLPRRGTGVRSMLAFGGNLTVFGTVNYFARNLDHILIGRYLGAGPLALYSKAYALLTLPLRQIDRPIGNVAIPTLSRLQDQPQMYRNYYLKAIKIIGFLAFPLIAAMAILSKEIILIVLGSQWIDASPVFMILAFAAFGQVICHTTGWVFVSLNQTDRMAKWGFISSPIICLSFIVGLPWGIKGIATSYLIATPFLIYANLAYCFKHTPIRVNDVLVALFRPAVLSLAVAANVMLVRFIFSELSPVVLGLIGFLAALLAMIGAICIWKKLREEMWDILELVRIAVRKKTESVTGTNL